MSSDHEAVDKRRPPTMPVPRPDEAVERLKRPVREMIRRLASRYFPVPPPDYFAWRRRDYLRLTRFKDRFRGRTCFVLGNGPSLNRTNLELLEGHYSFGLNKIHLIFPTTSFRPSFHVAVDRYVISQSAEAIAALECPSFIDWHGGRDLLSNHDRVHFVRTHWAPSFSHDIRKPMWDGYTVTYVALQIAFFMGFSTVILIGVDHSFSARGEPNEEQLMTGPDRDHFHPDYFQGRRWQLPDLESSEVAYRLARYAYERSGRRIVDATIGGKLDIFPKVDYTEALRLAEQD